MWNYPDVFICADDYGYNDGVSAAIIELLNAKRISGTSVIVNMPKLEEHAPALKTLMGQSAKVGLHFNFTEGTPLTAATSLVENGTFKPVKDQLKSILQGKMKEEDIIAEGKAQLQLFISTFGQVPDFIDGHQHIHAVPLIRLALLELVDAALSTASSPLSCLSSEAIRAKDGREGSGEGFSIPKEDTPLSHASHASSPAGGEQESKRPWFRAPNEKLSTIFARPCALKAWFVSLMAGGMQAHCAAYNFEANRGFSGFTNFDARTKEDYRASFLASLKSLGSSPLIMCHPSKSTAEPDAILPARMVEFAYFMSDEFALDLKEAGVKLV